MATSHESPASLRLRPSERHRSRAVRWAGIVAATIVIGSVLPFAVVQVAGTVAPLLFPAPRTVGAFRVYADGPLPETLARDVFVADSMVESQGGTIPRGLAVYLCSSPLRFAAVAVRSANGIFGLYSPLGPRIVVAPASLEMAPSGTDGASFLAVVLAHEAGHAIVAQQLTLWEHTLLPQWKREGMASLFAPPAGGSARPYGFAYGWESREYFRARVEMTFLRDVEHRSLREMARDRRHESDLAARVYYAVASSARPDFLDAALP